MLIFTIISTGQVKEMQINVSHILYIKNYSKLSNICNNQVYNSFYENIARIKCSNQI